MAARPPRTGEVRPVDARPGPPATAPHDLRRRRRPAVRERVELVHGGAARRCTPATRRVRAVPCWLIFDDRYRKRYAHLRSRAPVASPQAARERPAQAGLDARRPGRGCAASTATGLRRDRRAVQRLNAAARASTPTTAGATRPTTGRWAIPTARCTRASARSTSPRTTPSRSCPATSARAAACVTDEHARVLDQATSRSTACTPPATSPPRSWAATTSARREHRQQHGLRLPRRAPRRRDRRPDASHRPRGATDG